MWYSGKDSEVKLWIVLLEVATGSPFLLTWKLCLAIFSTYVLPIRISASFPWISEHQLELLEPVFCVWYLSQTSIKTTWLGHVSCFFLPPTPVPSSPIFPSLSSTFCQCDGSPWAHGKVGTAPANCATSWAHGTWIWQTWCAPHVGCCLLPWHYREPDVPRQGFWLLLRPNLVSAFSVFPEAHWDGGCKLWGL